MGTASTTKYVVHNANGTLQEKAALTTSAGASDAQQLPALNASGVLDSSIVNSTTTSAGASSAGKVVALNASGLLDSTIVNSTTASTGAGSSGKLPALDATGRLDSTFLPVGVGADTKDLVASEALAAGDFVNVWSNAGTANVRKADANTTGKQAHGFVLASVALGATAKVYFEGTNTQCTGLTPGDQYLGATAGKSASAPPTGAGKISQLLGVAVSATALSFEPQRPVILA